MEDQSANALARLEDEVQAGTPADHPESLGMRRSQDSFGLLRECRERERKRERARERERDRKRERQKERERERQKERERERWRQRDMR